MLDLRMTEAVEFERASTLRVLKLIIEAENTRFHLERGYSSLHDWLITAYRYSEGAANRRVKASRLLPLIKEEEFLDGTYSLSTLAMAESYLRGKNNKEEILAKLAGKSGREAEKILAKEFPEKFERETAKPINGEYSRLSVNIPNDTVDKLCALRDEMSHKLLSIGEVIVELVAEKQCVVRKCTFKDPISGKICGCSFMVQEDHIIPRAKGGSDDPANPRDLCRPHNILMAEYAFGQDFMQKWKTSYSS